jgi:hypothetical protein
MFGTRGSNTRKPLGPSGIAKGGEDSGASSRTGTPPAQKERREKEEKEAAKHVNLFRYGDLVLLKSSYYLANRFIARLKD